MRRNDTETTRSDKRRRSATSAATESKSPAEIGIAVENRNGITGSQGTHRRTRNRNHSSGKEVEDGEGGGERRSRDKRKQKVNEKRLMSRPSARLVDLTY